MLSRRFNLHQRHLSEEGCSVLSVLATVVMQCGKKSVERVAQCVAAIIPIHKLSLLSGVY